MAMAEAAAQKSKSGLARLTELAWQAVPAIASAIGFAGFVAVVGGAIEWVRFWSAGLPADQAVKVIPKQELVTIGAVALIAFTLAGLVAVLVVYVLDKKGDVSVPTLRGLVVLTVVGMVVTLVFARVDTWVYVLVGAWVLVTAVLSWIVLAGLPPALHDKDKRNETDSELLASLRAYYEADDLLTDLRFASDETEGPGGPGGLAMAMQISLAQRQCALALSRWHRALKRWSKSPGRKPPPKSGKWRETPPDPRVVEEFLDKLDATPERHDTVKTVLEVVLVIVIIGGTVALIAVNATRWTGLMFAVTVVLVVADFLVARATSKFAWYGVAVFFSVLLFGAALKIARTYRDPEVQPVALVRKSDDTAVCGIYVTENDKRVYVGRVQPAVHGGGAQLRRGRIFWVPSSDVDVVTVGALQGIKSSEKRALALIKEIYRDRAQVAAPVLKPETNTETFGPSRKRKVTTVNSSEEPANKIGRSSPRHLGKVPRSCARAIP